MVNQTGLNRIRREIARIAGTEDASLDLVLALLETDWNGVIASDRITCYECHGAIPYHEAISIKAPITGVFHRFCIPCCECEHDRKCYRCGETFQTSLYNQSIYCPKCKERPCPICKSPFSLDGELCQPCKIRRGIDDKWMRSEYVKVQTHIGRAVTLELPATLTLPQWIGTLEAFNWLCAYCLTSPYEQLDHYIPLCRDGGTTQSNCVPACKQCNKLKHQLHPERVTMIPIDALQRVHNWLDQFSEHPKKRSKKA